MKQFLKFTLASMLGFVLACIILFFLSMMIMVSVITLGQKEEVTIKENSVLHMKMDRPIVDRAPKTPDFSNFPESLEPYPGLNEIIKSLENAREDERIKGIYLELAGVPAGIGLVDELRNALIDFKSAGKFIIAYSDMYSQLSYYLATASDKIYMNPAGVFFYKGLNAELIFLKGTLDKLEIEAQVIRPEGNKYKSAIEPLILEKMSDANREQTTQLVNSIWDHMLGGIAESRNISIEELNRIADKLLINNPVDAVDLGMIDNVLYKDELLAELRTLLGIGETDKINTVKLTDYVDVKPEKSRKDYTRNKIAVVYALGDITMGEGDDMTIGAERISKAIRKARLDTNIRAIVLRVNSPGGDALASDIILREVILAREKKPVIASYGDVAASGGYWISCKADKIIAQPNTITGSIGVFGVWPNFQGFFNNKLGMTFDNVSTNENAGFPSINRPMTDYEKEYMQEFINDIYSQFLTYVSESRGMTEEEVDEIAQGRVWSGSDALEIGLIDDFGGLQDAIDLAAEMAGVEKYKIKDLPEQKSLMDQIMEELFNARTTSLMKKELGEHYKTYEKVKEISHIHGIQARMIQDINFN